MLLFADESSVQLLANVVHTYAPRGQTPTLEWWKKSQKVNAISAISPDGELFYLTRYNRFKSMGIVHFLKYLVRQTRRKIILVWDGAKIHFAEAVKKFLRTLKPGRLQLVKLPAHSPELNPDEQVWGYLKCESNLKNFAAKNFTELRQMVTEQFQLLAKNPDRIKKMFHHPDSHFY